MNRTGAKTAVNCPARQRNQADGLPAHESATATDHPQIRHVRACATMAIPVEIDLMCQIPTTQRDLARIPLQRLMGSERIYRSPVWVGRTVWRGGCE